MSQINEPSVLVEEGKGSIPDQLWANVMRKSMENKNLLVQKGALYVGTGNTETVNTLTVGEDGEYEQQQIAQTEALNPPHPEEDETTILEGYFLCTSKDGLVWRKLTAEDIPASPAVAKLPTVEAPAVVVKTHSNRVVVPVADEDGFWTPSGENQDEAGAYYKEILFSDIGLNSEDGNVLVQVMRQIEHGWTVVHTPVFITDTSVTVYTDTKFVGKILLFSLD